MDDDDDARKNTPWNVIKRVLTGKPAFLTIDVWREKAEHAKDPQRWIEKSDRLKRKAAKALPSKKLLDPPKAQNSAPVPVTVNPLRDSSGHKIIPELVYQQYDDHISGELLDMWFQFKNSSNVTLEIQYIELFNVRTQCCIILQPNQVKKVRAYNGQMPSSMQYDRVRVVYRELLSGIRDVFCGEYIVQWQQYHDTSHFTIHGLMKNGPTRDW